MVTVAFYTCLIVTINIVANASSNLLPDGFDVNTLTKTDIAQREYGSKLVLVVEQCQIMTVWTIKACLLTMYLRLTKVGHTREHLAIKILMGYVAFGWLFMEIFYFGVWCRPFYNYWYDIAHRVAMLHSLMFHTGQSQRRTYSAALLSTTSSPTQPLTFLPILSS